jgi:pimeloyl-ACP methyl ester carboxylesterase
VHAVGYSAGGQVLQQMLLLSPQRFKSVALVSTTAGGTRPFTGAYTLISNLFVSDPHEQLRRLMRINYTKVRMNILKQLAFNSTTKPLTQWFYVKSWLDQRPDDDSSVDTNFEKVFKVWW